MPTVDLGSCVVGPSGWVPRGLCGPWTLWLEIVYIVSNALISLSYLAIASGLIWTMLRHGAPAVGGRRSLTWLFVAFIAACGIGHAIENIGAFWFPNYPLFAAWHAMTAAISVATAVLAPIVLHETITKHRTIREVLEREGL